jgi:hypothetical protein
MSEHDNPSTIERAFELARAGNCRTMRDIRNALKAERHESIDRHLAGPGIGRQLQTIMKANRT